MDYGMSLFLQLTRYARANIWFKWLVSAVCITVALPQEYICQGHFLMQIGELQADLFLLDVMENLYDNIYCFCRRLRVYTTMLECFISLQLLW